ncbi:hypothetical protein D3C85_1609820 [compost metagenome]
MHLVCPGQHQPAELDQVALVHFGRSNRCGPAAGGWAESDSDGEYCRRFADCDVAAGDVVHADSQLAQGDAECAGVDACGRGFAGN